MSQRQKHLAFYGRASKSRHKKGQKLCCSVKPSAVSEINDCDVGFVPIALVIFYRIDSASVVNKKPHYNFFKQHCGHSESLPYRNPYPWVVVQRCRSFWWKVSAKSHHSSAETWCQAICRVPSHQSE